MHRARPSVFTRRILFAALAIGSVGAAVANPVTYVVDPDHTYPSFEADHMDGLSVWRGKFNHSQGTITLDRAMQTGDVDITVDIASVDFGQDKLNAFSHGKELFDVAHYPQATYHGRLAGFRDGKPTRVDGTLTLHGISQPLTLTIRQFKCMPHPLYKREVCGADALAQFQRDRFGMPAGKEYGFDMQVTLRIQVEAIAEPGNDDPA